MVYRNTEPHVYCAVEGYTRVGQGPRRKKGGNQERRGWEPGYNISERANRQKPTRKEREPGEN